MASVSGCCPLNNQLRAPEDWSLPSPYQVRYLYDEKTQNYALERDPISGQIQRKVCIYNPETNKAFRGYDPFRIMTLSGVIYVATPFVAVAKICWYVAQMVVFVANDLIDVAANTFALFKTGTNKYQALKDLGKNLLDIPKHIVSKIFQVVRTPFYSIAMTFAALFSVFCPYQGRELLARVEKSWLQGASKYNDFRWKIPDFQEFGNKEWVDVKRVLLHSLTDREDKTCFTIAYCFQEIETLRVVKQQQA